ADDEDAAVFHAIQQIVFDPHVARLHVGIGVVHDDAVAGDIHADIEGHFAIVKAVQVDAFAVDRGELVERVEGAVHIARRVHGHGGGASLHVHRLFGKADARAGICFHPHLGGVPYLERVAADGVETILREDAAGVARRGVERVGPDAVSPDIAQLAPRDAEIAGALYQQDAARRIV